MKRISFFLTLVSVCTVTLIAFPAHALAQHDAHATPARTTTSPQTIKLGPMVVKGQRLRVLPLPVQLQILKAALKRPASFRQENLSKLVCRFNQDPRVAIHQSLHCETNCDLLMSDEARRGTFMSCDIGHSADVNERLAAYINNHHFNRSQLAALLKQLPPPGSSYTFQVESHGKVVARWVIDGGQVVKVEVRKKDDHER